MITMIIMMILMTAEIHMIMKILIITMTMVMMKIMMMKKINSIYIKSLVAKNYKCDATKE